MRYSIVLGYVYWATRYWVTCLRRGLRGSVYGFFLRNRIVAFSVRLLLIKTS